MISFCAKTFPIKQSNFACSLQRALGRPVFDWWLAPVQLTLQRKGKTSLDLVILICLIDLACRHLYGTGRRCVHYYVQVNPFGNLNMMVMPEFERLIMDSILYGNRSFPTKASFHIMSLKKAGGYFTKNGYS